MPTSQARESRGGRPLGGLSWLLGFLLVAMANALVGGARLHGGLSARLWFHVYDLLHFTILGLGTGAVSWIVGHYWGTPRARYAATAVVSVAAGLAILTPDLRGPASRLGESLGALASAPVLAVCVSILVPAGEIVGERLGSTKLRPLTLVLPLAGGALNVFIFTHLLPGAHLFLAWGCAAIVAGGFRMWIPPTQGDRRMNRVYFVGLAVLGLLSIVVPVPPKAATMMIQSSGSVLYPFLSRLHAARLRTWLPDPMPQGEWFSRRDHVLPIAPTTRERVACPITILISVDALRADVLDSSEVGRIAPNIRALRERGVYFRTAYAPSNATVPTLTSVFTGKYYSQTFWSEAPGEPGGDELWPHEDASTRFPALLSSAGVRTVTYAPTFWLMNRFGVVGGFDDEAFITTGRNIAPRSASRWASGREVISRLRRRLKAIAKRGVRPTFFFVHLLEPHYPYNQGSNDSTDDFSRYLTEVSVVDQQIAKLIDSIADLGLTEEVALVLMADHGEAFGEHSTTKHGSTLYEEIVRVPLLFVVPGVEPRVVDTPVSLMDLGPTILDMYGVDTPGDFMGQSLVPALRGDPLELTRPIAFEARPKQGMVFPDGIKVIRDLRQGVLEAYDLHADPAELDNIYEGFGTLEEYFGPLAAFFHVHEIQREGYEVHGR